ncbi:MAG: transglycosylase domain-containing protein [bacterium]|nr:transglycosylase domain-containing protein [bacterium]
MITAVTKGVLLEFYHTIRKPLLFFCTIFIAFLIITPILIYGYFSKDLISKESITNANSKGIILYDRNNKPFFSFYEAKRKKNVKLSQIPEHLQEAIIASEDKDFYKHPGFSIPGIIRSFYLNLINKQIQYGGSTITQQLIKNSILTPKKSFFRKYQEVILAFEVERLYSKKEILEMYLNSIYLGEGAIGVGTAAQTYFSKDVKDLNLAESALLAAILPSPSRYSPVSGDFKEALSLQRRVLDKMAEQKYITTAKRDAAKQQEINITPTKPNANIIAPHFAIMVRNELLTKYSEQQLALSGLKIKTTIDLDLQAFAETTVGENVKNLAGNGVTNAAAIALDPKTSEILALVGSASWFNQDFGKINMAVAPRQSGSAFKPIVYAKAFEDRLITPGTVLKDAPTDFDGGYKPKNYDGKYRGNLLPRRALANSINVPAVAVMQKVGVVNAVNFANNLGIKSLKDPSNYGLSIVLGAGEVPLLELTNAYAVFANGGILNPAVAILEIRNKSNQVIYHFTLSPQKVLDTDVAFLISSILSDNDARAEVFGNALTIERPAAVKTGTTENYRDALTVGYTPSLVVGVWVGNSDNRPMDQVAGSLGAAPIWRSIITDFLRDKPIENFEVPNDMRNISICSNNGGQVRTATSSAYNEFFLPGTEPQGYCNGSASLSPVPSQITTPTAQTSTLTPSPIPTENKNENKKDKKD